MEREYRRRCIAASDIVDHLPRLFDETCRYPEAVVIELGVRSGNSTAAFLYAAEQLPGAHVWSVDIQLPHVPAWWGELDWWTVLVGDDLDDGILAQLPAEADIVFIDTTHTLEQTQAELATYWPRLRPGGVVLLHDVELEAPEMGFATQPQPPFPVRVAVEEFCAEIGVTPEFVPGCYGLGIIRKEA